MANLTWEYFPRNICSDDRPVATLKKDNREIILNVMESRTAFVSIVFEPFSFLHIPFVSYSDAEAIVSKVDDIKSLTTDEHLEARLKAACSIIQEKVEEDFEKVRQAIS